MITGQDAPCSLAYTATGIPIGFVWERANDCVTGATERLIRSQFAPMHGDSGLPNLTNVVFAMDRGYIQPVLLYDFLIPSGADVMGTIRRCPMFPFSFDQSMKPSDPRQDVPTKGLKTLLLKTLKVSDKQISGSANRDGKGGVILGINTMICSREWDLVVFDPQEAERFRRSEGDWEAIKWYKSCSKESNDDFDELFNALNV